LSLVAVFQPVSLDFGISAFEIRDHFTAVEWDAREQAGNDYRVRLDEYLTSQHINKRDTMDGQNSLFESQTSFSLDSSLRMKWDGLYGKKRDVEEDKYSPLWFRRGKLHLVAQLPTEWDDKGNLIKSGNVFDRDQLYALHDIYMKVISHSGYNSHCWFDYSEKLCFPAETLMPFFFKKNQNDKDEAVDLSGTGQYLTTDINRALGVIMQNHVWQLTDTNFSAANPKSTLMRFAFNWGTPLAGFNGPDDRYDQQIALMKDWLKGLTTSLSKTREDNKKNMTIYFGFVKLVPQFFSFCGPFCVWPRSYFLLW
jgi:hypothetical protein